MLPPETLARASKTPRQVRRARPGQGIVEANRKTEICKHWLQGECPFGAKCAFAHGAHELRPVAESHNASKMKNRHRLQSESEVPVGGERSSSCCDPRCTFHHGSCARSLKADNSITIHHRGDANVSSSNNNEAGGIDNTSADTTTANNINMLQASTTAPSMFSSSVFVGCTGQRSPLQELDSNGRGRLEHGGLLAPWGSPSAILQSSSLGWAYPTSTAIENRTTAGGGATQLSAFHKANSNPTNGNSSNNSHAGVSSASVAPVPLPGESETWANVVARRNSRRSFSASGAPPSSAPAPLPVSLSGSEVRGVSVPGSSSSSSSSAASPSACGRKECPCCASHAAAAAATATAAGSASATSSSSRSSSSASASASRWNATAHDSSSLFAVVQPATATAAAAQVTEAKPTVPATAAEESPQRPGRGTDSCEEDSTQAVASMMAGLSLNFCFKDEGDDDDDDDDELVGLSTNPGPWDVLPSFLLAQEELGGSASAQRLGRRSGGATVNGSSRLSPASQLSNSLHSLSTQASSSSERGTGDAVMGMGMGMGSGPLPGFRERSVVAPSWTTSPDGVWQPSLPNASSSSPKDGLFQVITPTPGLDFGWGLLNSSPTGTSSSSTPDPKDTAAGRVSRPVW